MLFYLLFFYSAHVPSVSGLSPCLAPLVGLLPVNVTQVDYKDTGPQAGWVVVDGWGGGDERISSSSDGSKKEVFWLLYLQAYLVLLCSSSCAFSVMFCLHFSSHLWETTSFVQVTG